MYRAKWIDMTIAGACVLLCADVLAQSPAPFPSRGPAEFILAATAKDDGKEMSEAQKADRCKNYSKRLAAIRDQQRRGVKAEIMDRLNREYDETDQSRRDLGC